MHYYDKVSSVYSLITVYYSIYNAAKYLDLAKKGSID